MTLFLYVIRDFFKYVFGTLLVCTFLFLLFDLIHKSTNYLAKYNPDTGDLIQYYIYRVPDLIVQGLPIAALLSSVICMVLLSRTNEITAMRAAGMSPLRIGLPIAAGGLILSGLSFSIGEFVLPETSKKMHYVETVLMEKKADYEAEWTEGIRWIKDGNNLYMFRDYDPVNKTMKGFRGYLELGKYKTFRPGQTVFADEVIYRPETDDWQLKNVKVVTYWPIGTVHQTTRKEDLVFKIPVEPEKLKLDRRNPNEKSLLELMEAISIGKKSGGDILKLEVDMHVKFAFHFASFIVCLIGLKFGYRSERSVETARSILMAISIGVSYWFILNAGQALGSNGTIPPVIAAWLANVVLFIVSVNMVLQASK
ncbi:MAG: LptF/LptG family permease [Oligoflexales bacterium]